mgnify:CR=1 FL=1
MDFVDGDIADAARHATVRDWELQLSGPDGVVRLSGGNPQIPKGYGDAPVQAYIAAMPGWKSGLGARLEAFTLDSAEFTDARSVNGTRVEGLLIPSGSSVIVRPRAFLSFGRVRAQVLSPVDVYDFL